MSKQLEIPVDDYRKSDFMEMIRAWIADEGLHCTIRVGIKGKEETIFWGILLADLTKHIGAALEKDAGYDKAEAIREIRTQMNAELDSPSDETFGYFPVN